MQTAEDYAQYESNMASYRALGDWFDYLRANNLYDNTRIIIVSDHGHASGEFDELSEDDLEVETDAEAFAPVLMVKDFNSTGFTTSDEFMTNADTPYLATEGLISNPVNPFTGNEITEDGKTGPQFVADNVDIDIHTNNGNTFVNSDWYTVQSDIWNKGQLEICRQLVDTGSIRAAPDMLQRECLKVKIGYGAKYQTRSINQEKNSGNGTADHSYCYD
ncbi:MAG: alkaline phosphatase family protein [Mageeibacillus sp.]|nr:alkaline phosphatase family protein [Mageeibacillus sp.]